MRDQYVRDGARQDRVRLVLEVDAGRVGAFPAASSSVLSSLTHSCASITGPAPHAINGAISKMTQILFTSKFSLVDKTALRSRDDTMDMIGCSPVAETHTQS